jgi:hypothetical protein
MTNPLSKNLYIQISREFYFQKVFILSSYGDFVNIIHNSDTILSTGFTRRELVGKLWIMERFRKLSNYHKYIKETYATLTNLRVLMFQSEDIFKEKLEVINEILPNIRKIYFANCCNYEMFSIYQNPSERSMKIHVYALRKKQNYTNLQTFNYYAKIKQVILAPRNYTIEYCLNLLMECISTNILFVKFIIKINDNCRVNPSSELSSRFIVILSGLEELLNICLELDDFIAKCEVLTYKKLDFLKVWKFIYLDYNLNRISITLQRQINQSWNIKDTASYRNNIYQEYIYIEQFLNIFTTGIKMFKDSFKE